MRETLERRFNEHFPNHRLNLSLIRDYDLLTQMIHFDILNGKKLTSGEIRIRYGVNKDKADHALERVRKKINNEARCATQSH